MAFLQKTWKDRVAEYINRRVLTKEDGTTELVSVERSEGTISQEGDAFSAANMNDLEQRIANEFSEQNKNLVAEDGTSFRFGVDENGNYGYIVTDKEGADSVIPFKSNLVLERVELSTHGTSYGIDYSTITLDVSKNKTLTVTGSMYHVTGGWLDIKNTKNNNNSIGIFDSYSETTKTFDVSAYEKIKLAVERPGQGGGNWTAFYGKIELT